MYRDWNGNYPIAKVCNPMQENSKQPGWPRESENPAPVYTGYETMRKTSMNHRAIYEDGTYLRNNPTWHEEDSLWKARQIGKMLRKNDIVPATVGEIGCGAGEIVNCLARDYGEKVLFSGYEISPQAYEICKTKQRGNLHFFLKNLFDEKEAWFDVVMAIDVFEHVEDYFGFLRQLRTKGEYKIFHIPLDLSVKVVMRRSYLLARRVSVGHIHYFTKETALATLQDTGYEIVDYFYTCISLEFPQRGGWKERALLNPFRKLLFFSHPDLAARVFGGFSLLVLAK